MSVEQGMPGESEQRTFSDEKRRAAEAAELLASKEKVTPQAVQPGESVQQAADRHTADAEMHEANAKLLREQGDRAQADKASFDALFSRAQADAVKGKEPLDEPTQNS